MFNLDAFDAEIDRKNRADAPGADVILAHSMRAPLPKAALTPFGATSGSVFGALAVVCLAAPIAFGSGSAEAMIEPDVLASIMSDPRMMEPGMMGEDMISVEEFAQIMDMDASDPFLIALYEEVCMT